MTLGRVDALVEAPNECSTRMSGRPSGRVDNRVENVLLPRCGALGAGADLLLILVSSSFTSFSRPLLAHGLPDPTGTSASPSSDRSLAAGLWCISSLHLSVSIGGEWLSDRIALLRTTFTFDLPICGAE